MSQVYSVLKTSEYQLEGYVIGDGGVRLKIIISSSQKVSKSPQGQIRKGIVCPLSMSRNFCLKHLFIIFIIISFFIIHVFRDI